MKSREDIKKYENKKIIKIKNKFEDFKHLKKSLFYNLNYSLYKLKIIFFNIICVQLIIKKLLKFFKISLIIQIQFFITFIEIL